MTASEEAFRAGGRPVSLAGTRVYKDEEGPFKKRHHADPSAHWYGWCLEKGAAWERSWAESWLHGETPPSSRTPEL